MSEKNDIAFALNYTNLYMINTTPGAAVPNWARLGAGIQTVTPSGNETTDQTAYYDGGGQASTDVTGGQTIFAFAGHRKYGDPAQDYIASLEYSYGEARKTQFRRISPDGEIMDADVTIANIVNGGGDANAKGTFSFELHNDGTPITTQPTMANPPESISTKRIRVALDGTSRLIVSVTPPNASNVCAFAVEDDSIATVDANGTVRGVAVGKTRISVKSMLKPSLGVYVDVEVTQGEPEPIPELTQAAYYDTGEAANAALGVKDCGKGAQQIFAATFNNKLGNHDYLCKLYANGHEYGLLVEAAKCENWTKVYWNQLKGDMIDFIDGNPNTLHQNGDLGEWTGEATLTVYQCDGASPAKYPSELSEIGTKTIKVGKE